ncbi:MAG: methyltransferase, TrmH family [Patescibacteria group bacterium]|nr:methyltransferase, TrmH family [Patescibacteria group bacterium]
MDNKKTITSEKNEIIKELLSLKKSRNRKKTGFFLIDGQRELEIALESGIEIEKIFLCSDFIVNKNYLLKNLEKYNQIFVSPTIFKKIAYKENPDGFLALVKKRKNTLNSLKPQNKEIVLVLEAVEKPGNLGAIIRTAYAAGVKNIILTNNQTDIYNPNVIRSSEGLLFKLNIIESNNKTTLSFLKDNNFAVFCAVTKASKDYTKVKYPRKCALIFGSEANGLSSFWLNNKGKNIKIPMSLGVDSLNVSVSVAIILFEVLRQNN